MNRRRASFVLFKLDRSVLANTFGVRVSSRFWSQGRRWRANPGLWIREHLRCKSQEIQETFRMTLYFE